jgi:hypothetical protein
MSSVDIRKGQKWQLEIGDKLEKNNFGIVCLTLSNLEAPWILFEAGALSKQVETSHLCTYLVGAKIGDIAEPLRPFQATYATREETLKLVETINFVLPDGPLPIERLRLNFEKWWPELESLLAAIPPDVAPAPAPTSLEQVAKGVEELLELTRAATQNQNTALATGTSAVMPRVLKAFSALDQETLERLLQGLHLGAYSPFDDTRSPIRDAMLTNLKHRQKGLLYSESGDTKKDEDERK